MAESKKDMTYLMDLLQTMQKNGQTPAAPEGSVMEEQKLEPIAEFESLEDFGKANPVAEPTPDTPPSESAFITTPQAGDGPSLVASLPGIEPPPPPLPEGGPLPTESASEISTLPQPAALHAESTFSPGGEDLSALAPGSQAPSFDVQAPSSDAEVEPSVQHSQSADGSPSFSSVSVAPEEGALEPAAIEEPLSEPLRPARKSAPEALQPMDKVRQFSEQLHPGMETVQAAFPFSLIITGTLAAEEKERLLDLLARENMGIREMDLETQFAEGKILIPRISEYAGILIISALRSTRAKIRFGPSDEIYATVDTRDSTEEALEAQGHEAETYSPGELHSAEKLPITTEPQLPGKVQHAVLDIVTASAALKTLVVQAESSLEYQRLLEALQRELKYKAYAKGATAITCFSVQLTQLHMPMHYRVMVTGAAVKTD